MVLNKIKFGKIAGYIDRINSVQERKKSVWKRCIATSMARVGSKPQKPEVIGSNRKG